MNQATRNHRNLLSMKGTGNGFHSNIPTFHEADPGITSGLFDGLRFRRRLQLHQGQQRHGTAYLQEPRAIQNG
jgi:hypothetical protein